MTKISCEKCGKEFNSKSHYTQHTKRKNPCINENKIKELITESVKETLTKLNIELPDKMSYVNEIVETKEITVNTSTFDELRTYYDDVLNKDKSTYKSTNDEPTPINCVSEMINKIPEELWKRENLSILDPCCGNGNFYTYSI